MEQPKQQNLRDMVPSHWHNAYDHAWLTLYSIALGTHSEFKAAKRVNLDEAFAFSFWGSMNYLDGSTLTIRFGPDGEVIADGALTQRQSGKGAWIAIVQPCLTNSPTNEYALKARASIIAALLISVTTRNYAYARVFDNCVSLTTDEATATSPVVLGPHGFDRPRLSGLTTLQDASARLVSKTTADRRRIELSLHWYDKSLRSYGVDSFLSNWIAIETLAMPDTSNVKPINRQLAEAYGLPYAEAAEKFCVGRLLGLRSRVVHDGEDLIVIAGMSDYMNCLYEELLHYALGMETNRLGQIAMHPSFSFEALLGAH